MKLALIRNIIPKVVDIISTITEGRRAENINRFMGDDLSKMLKYMADYHVVLEEEQRLVSRHRSNPGCQTFKPCAYHNGARGCRQGDGCEYVHMERDR